MKAAETGNEQLVALLLAAGADPTARNSSLKTAADIADGQGFLEVSAYIDNPSPTKFLNADQKRKSRRFAQQNGRPQDRGLSRLRRGDHPRRSRFISTASAFPRPAVLTDYNFRRPPEDAKKDIQTKNDEQMDDTTQKTLSRVFSRALMSRWTPVDSASGYPDCNKEAVMFQISPDQKVIHLGELPAGRLRDRPRGRRQADPNRRLQGRAREARSTATTRSSCGRIRNPSTAPARKSGRSATAR